ncbi:MAG: carboxymuconolactone decarboxylase family protein [Syntrophomonas sp.]
MSGNLPWFVDKYKENDPGYFPVVEEVVNGAMHPEVLDDKTKHLIVLALDVFKGAAQGVKVVAKQAREAGASEEEIKEVIRLAYYVSGMDIIKTSLSAFE